MAVVSTDIQRTPQATKSIMEELMQDTGIGEPHRSADRAFPFVQIRGRNQGKSQFRDIDTLLKPEMKTVTS